MTSYPVILGGDHAEFEIEHANTPQHERPDWPLPSFDARDWAAAFCKIAKEKGFDPVKDEDWMVTWFANALMRGYDEHAGRFGAALATTKVRFGFKGKTQLPLFIVWREYQYGGEVEHANVLFNSMDWIGF